MSAMSENAMAPPRRCVRSDDGRIITGVCAGLARYTRLDPVVFRVGFALLVITTGIGIALYIGAFLLMGAPDGGPSRIERARRRIFDGDTVLALLGAGLAVGVVFGLIGGLGSASDLAVIVLFGLAMLVARSRGVDLVLLARSMPERIKGLPLSSMPPTAPRPAPAYPAEGMIDLALLPRPEPHDTVGEPPPDATGTVPMTDTRPGTANTVHHTGEPPGSPPLRRRRFPVAALTMAIALATGALLFAATGNRPELVRIQIVLGGTLCVVAAGILLGAWFGRVRKLVILGAIMSLALASASFAGNAAVAKNTRHSTWRPVTAAQADQTHRFHVGEGVVDLTAVPLAPGQRVQVNISLAIGVLKVQVPGTVRVEVDGHAVVGDITVDRQITGGPGARVHRVLEPEVRRAGPVPTIALRIRSKLGDMEVRRGKP
jgi:phage shock protein PspC (stress-responsive transcriptional regulator)